MFNSTGTLLKKIYGNSSLLLLKIINPFSLNVPSGVRIFVFLTIYEETNPFLLLQIKSMVLNVGFRDNESLIWQPLGRNELVKKFCLLKNTI